ncbi:MAG TPA: hypothetical protein VLO07_07135 [Thermoanaerobaculia bacterium]|nr:hypothetical protein [Thermoanaerobaculia bacterium]
MKDPLAPRDVFPLMLFLLVAGGALVSVATTGRVSNLAAGFAVGAGAALLLSRLRRPADEDRVEGNSERP